MAETSDDKCVVCAKDCNGVACELCEKVSYCHDACEAADFISHRESCMFKTRNLTAQKCCAVCDKLFSSTSLPPVFCMDCLGIRYCSYKCKLCNEAEHKVFCRAYARLPLRPTIEHRLHLFFPENEAFPRFLWLEPKKQLFPAIIDPSSGVESSWGNDSKIEPYQAILYHRAAFLTSGPSAPNQSLGTATGLPPLRSLKGNALLCVRPPWDIIEDISPSCVPKLLASLRQREYDHKMSHDPRSGWPQSAYGY